MVLIESTVCEIFSSCIDDVGQNIFKLIHYGLNITKVTAINV